MTTDQQGAPMTDTRAAVTDRPLVESWGVRAGDRVRPYARRRHAQADAGRCDGRTVVPLIAADRLTDEALVDVVFTAIAHDGTLTPKQTETATRAALAALRAHLEAL